MPNFISFPSKPLEKEWEVKGFRRGCDPWFRCSSRSLIFLIASTPRRVGLKPGIRGRLVLLWFSASSRKRPSGAGVSTFIVSPLSLQNFICYMLVNIRNVIVNICNLFSPCCFSYKIYPPNLFIS